MCTSTLFTMIDQYNFLVPVYLSHERTAIKNKIFTRSSLYNIVELDHISKMHCMTLCIVLSTRGGNRDCKLLLCRHVKGIMQESPVLFVPLPPHLQLYTQYLSSTFYMGVELFNIIAAYNLM